jgi:hypothetical protein
MDCFVAPLATTASKHTSTIPPPDSREVFQQRRAIRKSEDAGKCRGRAAPAVSCASLCERNAHEHTGSAETPRHSLRNGFTAYNALFPATNSSCHRHPRIEGFAKPGRAAPPPRTWHQQRVPEPHAFAVRLSAVRQRFIGWLTELPALPPNSAPDAESVHRIPPHVRDDRERPSGGAGRREFYR